MLRERLSRVPLAPPRLRDRDLVLERELSRGVTERACDLDRVSSSMGVRERPRETLRLSDISGAQ